MEMPALALKKHVDVLFVLGDPEYDVGIVDRGRTGLPKEDDGVLSLNRLTPPQRQFIQIDAENLVMCCTRELLSVASTPGGRGQRARLLWWLSREREGSLAGFNTVSEKSCTKYGLFLWSLVFNLLRQLREDGGPYKYPLNEEQTDVLSALLDALDAGLDDMATAELEDLVHEAILALFSHIKADNRQDKYFNAVTCFAVITSFTDKGKLRRISNVTSQIMRLVYANRTTQMTEIRRMLNADPHLTFMEYGIPTTPQVSY
ncbi:hypothetical protein B0H19DRAFT_1250796 [Mycena capillaripes]|nr:hypothetical protein B0H19DRAFT_1250796 [Mycena capillaripes]